jgi:hypothetical protein
MGVIAMVSSLPNPISAPPSTDDGTRPWTVIEIGNLRFAELEQRVPSGVPKIAIRNP